MRFVKIILIMFSFHMAYCLEKTAYGYYSDIVKASNSGEWGKVVVLSEEAFRKFSKNPIAQDIIYQLAKAYFEMGRYDFANEQFSKYLSLEFSPKYYEEAIEYKFKIAKKYFDGTRRHIFHSRRFPRWASAKLDALKIFEEVIEALPYSDIASEALFYKGQLHMEFEDYQESVEAFQLLIKRFPKKEMAVLSFIKIGEIYLKQTDPKHPQADLLDLAILNLKRFEESFPKEKRLEIAKANVYKIKERYAKALLEIANFYTRCKKYEAAKIYYERIIEEFPNTETAEVAKRWLKKRK